MVEAFETALRKFAIRLGGINVLAATAACQATFEQPEKMMLWQRREVNTVLTSYGLSLDSDPGPLRAV